MQFRPGRLNVIDVQRDVMQPRASFTQEAAHDGLRSKRFQQLDAALPQRNHRRPHAFVLHRLLMSDTQAQRLVKSARRGDALDGNAEVIDACAIRRCFHRLAHSRLSP